MITQEQANAIAEREYPEPDMVNEDFPTRFRVKLSVRIERKAYAKALMDMNPLIEAGEHLSEAVKWSHDDADYKAPEQFTKTYVYGRYLNPLTKKAVEFDTALSNLTKNIEP